MYTNTPPSDGLNAHRMLPAGDDTEQPSRSPNATPHRKTPTKPPPSETMSPTRSSSVSSPSAIRTPPTRSLSRPKVFKSLSSRTLPEKSEARGFTPPRLQRKRSISMDYGENPKQPVRQHRSRSMEFVPPKSSRKHHRSRSMELGGKTHHRSRSMEFNPHPLENVRISTLFALDEQKGVTLNLLPTNNHAANAKVVLDVPETLTEVYSSGSSGECDKEPALSSRPSGRQKQASLTNVFECEAPSRDQPLVHIKANRRGSNSSVVSELSFRDEIIEEAIKTARRRPLPRTDDVNSSMRSRRDLLQPSQIEESFPNHPHPALEYPPLYFCIRSFPRLLDLAESFFRMRWRLSYPLQRRIPFSRTLRKLNVFMTVAEMLLIVPFFAAIIACTVYSFVFPSVSISGHAARTPLIFAFATAMRNSLLTLLLGIPFERALWYHKLSARLAYVNGLLHTYVAFVHPDPVQMSDDSNVWMPPSYTSPGSDPNFGTFLVANQVNTGGTMLILFITLMIITALPWVCHKTFEFFYYLHVLFAASMIVCAFLHTGILVPAIGACTWGLDLVIRKIGMAFCRYPRKASVRIISDSVVELCFPKTEGFDYNPGQYIYLAVPELSILQWHPFSLSSSPEQKIVTLHIRKAGSWTTALYELAKKKMEINVLMEGPYGAVGVNVASPDRYKMVMLFSGGIGVTPMQALCNQMMYEHSTGLRELKKLSFVWIERDPNVMQKVDVVRRRSCAQQDLPMDDLESQAMTLTEGGPQGIASTLLALVPASGITDEQLELQYPSTDFDVLDNTNDDDSIVIPHSAAEHEDDEESPSIQRRPSYISDIDDDTMNQSFLDAAYNHKSDEFAKSLSPEEEVLDLQVYLTARGVATAHLPFVHAGRPDIKELFRKMRTEAIQQGEHRVAVCVCAPKRVVTICQKACTKYSDKKVRFDFHYEVFD